MKKANGFTLLELMTIVAVIGILATIALATYSQYQNRAKLAEVITISSVAKQHIVEYFSSTGELPVTLSDISVENTPTTYIANVGLVNTPNTVSVVYTVQKMGVVGDFALTGTIQGSELLWSCDLFTTIPQQMLPKICRS